MKTELSQVVDALVDRKAVDPVVLDLRGLTAATDYFVIVSGTSAAHVRGMAEHLVTALAPAGLEPHHVEGLAQGDRKSTRLNSSHSQISYAVFCLKKKKTRHPPDSQQHTIVCRRDAA